MSYYQKATSEETSDKQMCGIGGYYQTGNTNNAPKWAKPALRKMWDNLQSRGSDASGIAYESPT